MNKTIIVLQLLCGMLFLLPRGWAEDLQTPGKNEAGWAAPPPAAFDFQCTRTMIEFAPSANNKPGKEINQAADRTQGRFQTAHGSALLSCESELKAPDGRWGHRVLEQQLWDGRLCWCRQQPSNASQDCAFNYLLADEKKGKSIFFDDGHGGFLDGFYDLDQKYALADLLKAAERQAKGEKIETIDGHPCRVIEGQSGNMQFRLWIDPSLGQCVRQADFFVTDPRPSLLRRIFGKQHYLNNIQHRRGQLRGVVIGVNGGQPLALAGSFFIDSSTFGGKVLKKSVTVRRSGLAVPAVQSVSPRFTMDYPEGTLVSDDQTNTCYVWRQGRLQAFIDPTCQRRTAEALKQMGALIGARRSGLVADVFAVRERLADDSPTTSTAAQSFLPDPCYDPAGRSSAPYCLYAALRLTGRQAALAELLMAKTAAGQSVFEHVAQVARQHGLLAVVKKRLTTRFLRQSTHPVMLAVKHDVRTRDYDHYVLFLGVQNGQALLFDPARALVEEPFAELASRWDGNGLILAPALNKSHGLPVADCWQYLIPLGLAGIMMGGLQFARRRNWRRRWLPAWIRQHESVLELAALALATLLVAVTWNLVSESGLLKAPRGSEAVRLERQGDFAPPVGLAEVKQIALGKTQAVLIDARDPRSYWLGHIPGAVNIPVMLNEENLCAAIAKLPPHSRLVIYCQNAHCHFARSLATFLLGRGYSSVEVFIDGWETWRASGPGAG